MTFKIIFTLSCIFSSLNLVAAGQHTDGTGGNISAPIFSEAPGRLKLEILNTENKLQTVELEFSQFLGFDGVYTNYKILNPANEKRKIKKIERACRDYKTSIKANTEAIFFNAIEFYYDWFISKNPNDSRILDFNLVKKKDYDENILCSEKMGEISREVFLAAISNYFQKVAQRYLFTLAETEFLYETGTKRYPDSSKTVSEILALSFVERHAKFLAYQLLEDVNIRNRMKDSFYYRVYHRASIKEIKAVLPNAFQDIDEALGLFFRQDYTKSILSFLEGFDEFLLQALDIAKFGFEKSLGFEKNQGIEGYKSQIAIEFPFYEKSFQYSEQVFRVAPGSAQWQNLKDSFLSEFSNSKLKPAICRWDKNEILRFDRENYKIESPAKLLKNIFSHFLIIFGHLGIEISDLGCQND